MAINMSFLVVMALPLVLLASSAGGQNQDLEAAISEMQRANYFTFITLLHMMSPWDPRFQANLTFLMPNNRMLSKMTMQQHDVPDFLLRHSIPSPMLFDHLEHIPTGSVIPTSKPDYSLKISNNGRKNFFLNNARLISPNICTAGSVFRCHGIDGVLLSAENTTTTANNSNSNSASCVSTSSTPAPLPSTSPPPPLANEGSSTSAVVTFAMLLLWVSCLSTVQ